MLVRDNAYLRNQRMRSMRPDATRWVRADAVRFLKPGARLADAFPALDVKYNPSQPRIPAGNGRESGRWGNVARGQGNAGGVAAATASPMGDIDVDDLSEISDLGLFQTTPSDFDLSDFAQLAGDIPEGDGPGIGHNQGPPLEPPEIPTERPEGKERTQFIRESSAWLRLVGRYSPYVDAFFGLLSQIDETNAIANAIKSNNDPPRTLEELQDRVGPKSESGYEDHHIAEKAAALNAGYPKSLVDSRDNMARIPVMKHIDITSEYRRNDFQPDGSFRSLRGYLQDKDLEARRSVGLAIMRKHGVLK